MHSRPSQNRAGFLPCPLGFCSKILHSLAQLITVCYTLLYPQIKLFTKFLLAEDTSELSLLQAHTGIHSPCSHWGEGGGVMNYQGWKEQQ